MKPTLLVALSLAFTGVTLFAAADEAAACVPPNCPGFGTCYVETERLYLEDGHVDYPSGIDCHY